MPVAPVRVFNPSNGRTIDTYAALDTAAEYSLCSPELPELLGLEGEEVLTSVVGATGTAEEGESLRVERAHEGVLFERGETRDIQPRRLINEIIRRDEQNNSPR